MAVNPFLVAIGRPDSSHTPRLALLFMVRAAMRLRLRERIGQPTQRQVELELAAITYPLPRTGSVERTKMVIAARTRGLIEGDPPYLTEAGNAMLAPFDQETS